MPTDTARGSTLAVRFALRGVVWSLGLLGLIRLPWFEAHAVLPLVHAQAAVALGVFGASALPIEVTLACSGADAAALCLGAVLAYPVPWRLRLAGAVGGAALILGLNTLRIGTLGLAAASPAWFPALHLYLWPALLTLAVAGYVFAWMRRAERGRIHEDADRDVLRVERPIATTRFVVLTGIFMLLFAAASPFYLHNAGVLAVAAFVARAAAAILGVAGVSSYAAANVLWTPRGGFLVTQECISTPLLPVYLAAICSQSTTWARRLAGIAGAAPLFIALGIMRLIVVALPAALVASPLFLVHAFYQLLLGVVVVFLAARWRHGNSAAFRQALIGVSAGIAFIYFLGPLYTHIVRYPAGAVAFDDPQGAIAFLPEFQAGLYLALWIAAFLAIGWRRFLIGFAMLEIMQTSGLLALHFVVSHAGLTAHVRDVRGWAVAGPLLVVAAVVNLARPRH